MSRAHDDSGSGDVRSNNAAVGGQTDSEPAPVLPKHVTPSTLTAIHHGLQYLASVQSPDGSWHEPGATDGYPVAVSSLAGLALLSHGCTPTRGPYASEVSACTDYLLECATDSGLITGPQQEMGRPMHGHGFALLYLASVYGMESRSSVRPRILEAVERGTRLTAAGQSAEGGWTYTPGTGDEGSVTVTQVQALRAAHNAGVRVPSGTIEKAVEYIGKCTTPEGGIRYSLRSGGGPRLPISAAAVATLYNAGQYDAPVAGKCLTFIWNHFDDSPSWQTGTGHDFYCHLYAAQAFYLSGDKYWDAYYPATRDRLIAAQASQGSWDGDSVGQVYGTSIALIILQLPYKFMPVFQR